MTAVAVSITVALVAWRDRLTFDVLSSIAFFGTPVLVGGLAFT